MSKKNKPDNKGFVYSTDPEFRFEHATDASKTLLPSQQKLKVRLNTKLRGGKVVTLVDGFVGTESDLEDLGKKIKTYCGTGGSAKENEIIVQGDQRDKVIQFLVKNGFTQSKLI